MRLIWLVFVIIFGRGSRQPHRAACIRVSIMLVTAVIAGYLISSGFGQIASDGIGGWRRGAAAVFITEVCVLLVLLSAYGLLHNESDRLLRQLMVLPVRQVQVFMAALLPGIILSSVAVAFVLPSLIKFMGVSGLSVVPTLLAAMFGAWVGIGLMYGWVARYRWVQFILCAGTVTLQYRLLGLINNPQHEQQVLAFMMFGLVILVLIAQLTGSWRVQIYRLTRLKYTTQSLIYPAPYFFKKILRSTSMRLGMVVTLLMSAFIVFTLKRQQVADPQIPIALGMVFTGALAADIRPLAAWHNPAEITAIRGSFRFIASMAAAGVGCLLAILPMFTLLNMSAYIPFTVQVLAGASIGMMAGTITMSEYRDITGQLLSGALCVATIFIQSRLSHVPAAATSTFYYSLLALACFGTSIVVEYKRNKYIWRKYVR